MLPVLRLSQAPPQVTYGTPVMASMPERCAAPRLQQLPLLLQTWQFLPLRLYRKGALQRQLEEKGKGEGEGKEEQEQEQERRSEGRGKQRELPPLLLLLLLLVCFSFRPSL
jgi:hypothetical protein